MPFLGKQPAAGNNNVLLDAITTSATATYNLTKNSTAYVPGSAQSLMVSLNGVTQAPVAAYTVSGSQITFASALTSNDVIDYIIAFTGPKLQADLDANTVGTSALIDDAVTADKIADNSVDIARLNVSDGSNGQALTTNGSGTLSFATVAGGTPSDNSVTSAKIVNGTIVTDDLANDAVTSAKIADNTIAVGNMAAGTLKMPGTRNIGIGASSLTGGSLTGIDNISAEDATS